MYTYLFYGSKVRCENTYQNAEITQECRLFGSLSLKFHIYIQLQDFLFSQSPFRYDWITMQSAVHI